MKKKPEVGPMVQIGVTRESVLEARAAIVEILGLSTEAAQVAALNCLAHLCSVNNTRIENCQFTVS